MILVVFGVVVSLVVTVISVLGARKISPPAAAAYRGRSTPYYAEKVSLYPSGTRSKTDAASQDEPGAAAPAADGGKAR